MKYATCLAGFVLVGLVSGAAAAETMDALYAAAKKEGALVLVGGGPAPQYERFARDFEQRFPGIQVAVTGGPSNVHAGEIDQQLAGRALRIDLALLQTVQDFERWKSAGALTPFKPEGFDQIDDGWKDKDGAYVGVYVNGLAYAYNPEKVARDLVPRSALDFLKSEFKGKLITTYPHVDDVTLYLFQTIIDKYGWEFLDKLKANDPSFVRGHLGVARAISAGEKTATFDAVAKDVLDQAAEGQPIALAVSEAEPMPIWSQIAAVFKDAPHANAAKLFLAWYLQPEQQRRMGTWSSRSDVAPPPGLKPLASYRLANAYRAFIMDETRAKMLRERYLSFTGPVTASGTYR